jgi:hypothetical protein
MKKIMLAAFAVLSMNAFSQSYLVLDNGVTLTTDKKGFVYDFGNYAVPQKITLKGGSYFVEDGGVLATIDDMGVLFRKYESIPAQLKGKGMNYFMGANGDLYTVDHAGVVNLKNDPKFMKASSFGGNYFTVIADDATKMMEIYAVGADGNFAKSSITMKSTDVVAYGGNYFMNNRGVVFTVSDEGKITPNPGARVGILVKKGGNYFVDSSGAIFTVAANGTLYSPTIPNTLFVQTITKTGTNYFLDKDSRLFSVDDQGQIFERVLNGLDLHTARIISL